MQFLGRTKIVSDPEVNEKYTSLNMIDSPEYIAMCSYGYEKLRILIASTVTNL